MALYNTIKINGTEFIRPNDFQLNREDVYAGEYTTCTGKLIADRIGWRYADMDMSWDHLPQEMLDVLLALRGAATIVFSDADGQHTENVMLTSRVVVATRITDRFGRKVWKDVSMGVRFTDVHT